MSSNEQNMFFPDYWKDFWGKKIMHFFQSEFLKHKTKVYINKCNVIPQQLLKTMTATFVLTISIFFLWAKYQHKS